MYTKLADRFFRFVFILVFVFGLVGAPNGTVLAQGSTGAMSGMVTDANGIPISDATVCAYDYDRGPTQICSQSGLDGSYTIMGLPAADYRVFVSAAGWGSQLYNDKYEWLNVDRVSVQSDQTTGGIDFHLVSGGSISGTIYESDGVTPVAYKSLNLISDNFFQGACSDANGHYSFNGVPFGIAWHVRVIGPAGYCWGQSNGYISEFWQDVYDWADATALILDADHPFYDEINFTLMAAAADPLVNVRANTDQVEVFGWAIGDTLHLTVDDPSTLDKNPDYEEMQTVSGTAPWDPSQSYVEFYLPDVYDIKTGDIVRVSNGTIAKVRVVSNLAIDHVDIDANTVSGTAEPGQGVSVWTCLHDVCVNRDEIADSNGDWSTNFGGPGDQTG